jgi:hypothetical protein
MTKRRTRSLSTLRGGAAIAVTIVMATLAAPAPATAAPASGQEKGAALSALELLHEPGLHAMTDCNFVTAVWQRIETRPFLDEVRTAAVRAFAGNAALAGDLTECTTFIRTGVHEAKARDVATEASAKEQRRIDRERRSRAAQIIGVVATEAMLAKSVKEFVWDLRQLSTGPRVKKAAEDAFNGTDDDRDKFLAGGIAEAHEGDRKAVIEDDDKIADAEKRSLIEAAARKRAGAVLLMDVTPVMLSLPDWNFVNLLWRNAPADTEVKSAALDAVTLDDAKAWRDYIHTGIHDADFRDFQKVLQRKREADRNRAREIIEQAKKDGHANLVHATEAALAGTPNNLDKFLRDGQYDLDFHTGLAPKDIAIDWARAPLSTTNIKGYCCNLSGAEFLTADGPGEGHEPGNNNSILYSGYDDSTQESFAYRKVFTISRVRIKPTTTLTYYIKPEKKFPIAPWSGPLVNNSTCVAVDLHFSDGRTLRDSQATDQDGRRAHPAHQCSLHSDTWRKVTVKLGEHFTGTFVNSLAVGYDQPANTGPYRGFVDDITIAD